MYENSQISPDGMGSVVDPILYIEFRSGSGSMVMLSILKKIINPNFRGKKCLLKVILF